MPTERARETEPMHIPGPSGRCVLRLSQGRDPNWRLCLQYTQNAPPPIRSHRAQLRSKSLFFTSVKPRFSKISFQETKRQYAPSSSCIATLLNKRALIRRNMASAHSPCVVRWRLRVYSIQTRPRRPRKTTRSIRTWRVMSPFTTELKSSVHHKDVIMPHSRS